MDKSAFQIGLTTTKLTSPPAPLQLERGALLRGILKGLQAERFVLVQVLSALSIFNNTENRRKATPSMHLDAVDHIKQVLQMFGDFGTIFGSAAHRTGNGKE